MEIAETIALNFPAVLWFNWEDVQEHFELLQRALYVAEEYTEALHFIFLRP